MSPWLFRSCSLWQWPRRRSQTTERHQGLSVLTYLPSGSDSHVTVYAVILIGFVLLCFMGVMVFIAST